jgi:hypothetical protein
VVGLLPRLGQATLDLGTIALTEKPRARCAPYAAYRDVAINGTIQTSGLSRLGSMIARTQRDWRPEGRDNRVGLIDGLLSNDLRGDRYARSVADPGGRAA